MAANQSSQRRGRSRSPRREDRDEYRDEYRQQGHSGSPHSGHDRFGQDRDTRSGSRQEVSGRGGLGGPGGPENFFPGPGQYGIAPPGWPAPAQGFPSQHGTAPPSWLAAPAQGFPNQPSGFGFEVPGRGGFGRGGFGRGGQYNIRGRGRANRYSHRPRAQPHLHRDLFEHDLYENHLCHRCGGFRAGHYDTWRDCQNTCMHCHDKAHFHQPCPSNRTFFKGYEIAKKNRRPGKPGQHEEPEQVPTGAEGARRLGEFISSRTLEESAEEKRKADEKERKRKADEAKALKLRPEHDLGNKKNPVGVKRELDKDDADIEPRLTKIQKRNIKLIARDADLDEVQRNLIEQWTLEKAAKKAAEAKALAHEKALADAAKQDADAKALADEKALAHDKAHADAAKKDADAKALADEKALEKAANKAAEAKALAHEKALAEAANKAADAKTLAGAKALADKKAVADEEARKVTEEANRAQAAAATNVNETLDDTSRARLRQHLAAKKAARAEEAKRRKEQEEAERRREEAARRKQEEEAQLERLVAEFTLDTGREPSDEDLADLREFVQSELTGGSEGQANHNPRPTTPQPRVKVSPDPLTEQEAMLGGVRPRPVSPDALVEQTVLLGSMGPGGGSNDARIGQPASVTNPEQIVDDLDEQTAMLVELAPAVMRAAPVIQTPAEGAEATQTSDTQAVNIPMRPVATSSRARFEQGGSMTHEDLAGNAPQFKTEEQPGQPASGRDDEREKFRIVRPDSPVSVFSNEDSGEEERRQPKKKSIQRCKPGPKCRRTRSDDDDSGSDDGTILTLDQLPISSGHRRRRRASVPDSKPTLEVLLKFQEVEAERETRRQDHHERLFNLQTQQYGLSMATLADSNRDWRHLVTHAGQQSQQTILQLGQESQQALLEQGRINAHQSTQMLRITQDATTQQQRTSAENSTQQLQNILQGTAQDRTGDRTFDQYRQNVTREIQDLRQSTDGAATAFRLLQDVVIQNQGQYHRLIEDRRNLAVQRQQQPQLLLPGPHSEDIHQLVESDYNLFRNHLARQFSADLPVVQDERERTRIHDWALNQTATRNFAYLDPVIQGFLKRVHTLEMTSNHQEATQEWAMMQQVLGFHAVQRLLTRAGEIGVNIPPATLAQIARLTGINADGTRTAGQGNRAALEAPPPDSETRPDSPD